MCREAEADVSHAMQQAVPQPWFVQKGLFFHRVWYSGTIQALVSGCSGLATGELWCGSVGDGGYAVVVSTTSTSTQALQGDGRFPVTHQAEPSHFQNQHHVGQSANTEATRISMLNSRCNILC